MLPEPTRTRMSPETWQSCVLGRMSLVAHELWVIVSIPQGLEDGHLAALHPRKGSLLPCPVPHVVLLASGTSQHQDRSSQDGSQAGRQGSSRPCRPCWCEEASSCSGISSEEAQAQQEACHCRCGCGQDRPKGSALLFLSQPSLPLLAYFLLSCVSS